MKLTIVADDNTIGVNDLHYFNFDLQELDSAIHAVQWYGEYGEVEYKTRLENGVFVKPANVVISSVEPYKSFVALWNVAHEKALAVPLPTIAKGLIPVTEA